VVEERTVLAVPSHSYQHTMTCYVLHIQFCYVWRMVWRLLFVEGVRRHVYLPAIICCYLQLCRLYKTRLLWSGSNINTCKSQYTGTRACTQSAGWYLKPTSECDWETARHNRLHKQCYVSRANMSVCAVNIQISKILLLSCNCL
jgi:hypothetical protein